VIALGRVENLRPLYAAARLVVVPLLEGTGVSIKTLEAITFGKPVLATAMGLRGLDPSTICALPSRFDVHWAETIISLLGSSDERRIWRNRLLTTIIAQADIAEAPFAFDRLVDPNHLSVEARERSPLFEQVASQNLIEWPVGTAISQ
jgi:hypothetical protein